MPAPLRDLKRKIKSIRSTQKITAAMQLVAASKMQRATERALAARDYSTIGQEILRILEGSREEATSPFLEARPAGDDLLVIFSSNRGLAGPLNTQLYRTWLDWQRRDNLKPKIIVVGQKARSYILRYAPDQLIADFPAPEHVPDFSDVRPIAKLAIDDFLKGTYRRIWVLFSRFINTLEQRPELSQFLPIPKAERIDQGDATTPIFEPDETTILTPLLERLLRAQFYQIMLESHASEQSARMIAMKNATDNATDLIGDLELTYNSARQAAITGELLDIAAGASALTRV